MKKISLACLAVAGLFANGSAFAATCPITATTVSSFLSIADGGTGVNTPCTQQDVIWSNFKFTSYAANSITQSTLGFGLDVINGDDTHTVSLNLSPSVVPGTAASFSFSYKGTITTSDLIFDELSQGFTKISGSISHSTTRFYTSNGGTLLGTISDNGVTVIEADPFSVKETGFETTAGLTSRRSS